MAESQSFRHTQRAKAGPLDLPSIVTGTVQTASGEGVNEGTVSIGIVGGENPCTDGEQPNQATVTDGSYLLPASCPAGEAQMYYNGNPVGDTFAYAEASTFTRNLVIPEASTERPYKVFAPSVARTFTEPAVQFTVPSTILAVDETREIDISVSVPQGQTLGALTLDITYDPALVSADCVAGRATCNPIYPCNVQSPPSCQPSRIRLVDASTNGINGLLQTVSFTGKSVGAFTYAITIVTCSNTSGQPLPNCQATTGGVQVEGGSGGTCDPAYPTVCIPSPPPTLNCSDIPASNFVVLPPDPHNLDGNGNGIGCES